MLNNKYEYTKTIRFNLEGEKLDYLKPKVSSNSKEKILAEFYNNLQLVIENFKKVFFYKIDSEDIEIRKKVEIKKSWLRRYLREAFYKLPEKDRDKNKKYSASLFQLELLSWLADFEKIYKEISNFRSQEKHEKKSEADFRLLIQSLISNDYAGFLRELTLSGILNDKESDQGITDFRKSVSAFLISLEELFYFYASDLNQGLEVARASFNIATINKISKNFDGDIQSKIQEQNALPSLNDDQKRILKESGFLLDESLSLEDLYSNLKQYKSEQKRSFIEAVQKKQSIDNFPMFNNKKDILDKYINEQDAKKRGTYFQNKWGFDRYVNYCNEIFKPIAKKFGQHKAEIRALEQEKIEARLLKYWAIILEQGEQKKLLLLPKEYAKKAEEILKNIQEDPQSEYVLCTFNSLTLRALNKLIRRNLGKEQQQLQNDSIRLYQEVLRENGIYSKLINIDFNDFSDDIKRITNEKYQTEDDFRIDLEKNAYVCERKKVSTEFLTQLKNEYGALELNITSYDSERQLSGDIKEHTKIWRDFWGDENQSGSFPTRINPEVRLFYRPTRKQKEPEKQKNRFSKEHFGIAFTISQNAAQKELKTTFVNIKKIKDKIQKFNEEVIKNFTQKNQNNLWYFGIDRGNTELATLGVVKWTEEKYKAMLLDGNIKNLPKPDFANIEVLKIKDLNEEKASVYTKNPRKIINNPSYFMEDEGEIEKYFIKEEVAFIDLTTAKLIKNKIILNGDTKTYLNLKKANGKRKLFEVFDKIDSEAKVEFCDEYHSAWNAVDKNGNITIIFRESFLVKFKEGEENDFQILCYLSSKPDQFIFKEELQNDLQNYLEELRNDSKQQSVSIDEINHLRDAITANMVGIIAFLFDQYPAIINLENLHSDIDIQRHFSKNNENIARRLEWSLYKKFQKKGLVPPNLKQTIILKDKELKDKLNQFGIIHFVPTEDTSSTCPYCLSKISGEKRKDDKFSDHAFICNKCDFTTKNPKEPFTPIKNSDEVAAYNIAKSEERMREEKAV